LHTNRKSASSLLDRDFCQQQWCWRGDGNLDRQYQRLSDDGPGGSRIVPIGRHPKPGIADRVELFGDRDGRKSSVLKGEGAELVILAFP
jgi:hypothetical protein